MAGSEVSNLLESLSKSEDVGSNKAGQDGPDPPESNVPLDIIEATQKSADLYRSGARLYVRSDLERIENELSHCQTTPSFTIRRIDGSTVSVKNPMYGVSQPMWKPYIQFRHYWHMVRGCIDRSSWHTILPCYSYCIEWKSLAYRQFKENEIEPLEGIFKNVRKRWERSLTHDWLVDNLAMLQGTRRITKILCFGLGNISKELLYNGRDEEWRLYCMTQHAVALSMADIFRSEATDVKVFVQDPAYSKADKALLKSVGITVVGECGAGGFSMIDDETVVFSCCPSVPVAQIVADVGRPAMIIGNSMISRILNNASFSSYPADTKSPRTREMMKEYTPHVLEDKEKFISTSKMKMFVRNEEIRSTCTN
ncbi:hypothetical protein F4820DRAFT_463375 [Hypoxylon rubiginosum]|uniref:Uncharacterized protein n=1 Tax=Hypoxylon rubiginosum TaxID=110542 RepID=A0ACB9ZIW9_9PEZI|nr:hypothetical protein F4820DRAFT_463375 [Hypoxylon rubiginosum]